MVSSTTSFLTTLSLWIACLSQEACLAVPSSTTRSHVRQQRFLRQKANKNLNLQRHRGLLRPKSVASVLSAQEKRLVTRRLSAQSWEPMGVATSGKSSGEQFGFSLALSASGTVLVAGAPLNDDGGTSSGRVRVYQYLMNSWTEGGDINGEGAFDEFGRAVAMNNNGNRFIAGGPNNRGNGSDSGSARVFNFNSTTSAWDKMGQDLDGEGAGVHAGTSVAMNSDGSIVAVGSPYSNTRLPNGTLDQMTGQVRVYQYSTNHSNWTEILPSIRGVAKNSLSGWAVDLAADGKVVAVGAPDYNGVGHKSGQVRVYMRKDDTWSLLGLPINASQAGEELGYALSLSMDGMSIAIGRPNLNANGTKGGAVQVFKYSSVSKAWAPVGNLVVGERAKANFGASVSLSADGMQFVARSNFEVRQFSYYDTAWFQIGASIGNTGADTIAMSADGNKVAIGEIGGSGSVSVFSYPDQVFDISLVNIHGSFTDQGEDVPEVELTYANSAPVGGYYTVIILDEDCTVVDTSGSIKPRLDENGTISSAVGTSDVTVQIDVDTSLVVQSNYYTPGATTDTGTIDFCVKIDFFDESKQSVATKSNKIKLELDQRTSFSTGSGGSIPRGAPSETVHYIDFDYTTQTYYCDDSNTAVTPGPQFPGQVVQFCVRTPISSEVQVKALRSVVFKNTKVPLMAIPILDESGNPTNNMTSVTCFGGICNVKSIAFSDLYEYVLGNGTLVDVSSYVILDGRALLAFVAGTRRQLEYEHPFIAMPDISVLKTTGADTNGNAKDDAELKAVLESQDEEAATSFRLHLDLERPASSSAFSCRYSWLTSLVVAGLSSLVLMMG